MLLSEAKVIDQTPRIVRTTSLMPRPPVVAGQQTNSLKRSSAELPLNAIKRYREASKLGRSNMIIRNIYNANQEGRSLAFSYADEAADREIITIWRTQ